MTPFIAVNGRGIGHLPHKHLSHWYPVVISLLIAAILVLAYLAFFSFTEIQHIRSLNQKELVAWRKIRNDFNYLFSHSMEGSAKRSVQKLIQSKMLERLNIAVETAETLHQKFEELEHWRWIILYDVKEINELQEYDISQDLVKLIRTVTKAPVALIDTGTSAWDSNIVISIQSESAFKLLEERDAVLASIQKTNVSTLWISFTILVVMVLALIWWTWYRIVIPAFSEVSYGKDRLRTIVNSLGEGVISVDQNGMIMATNPLARELSGLCVEDVDAGKGEPIDTVLKIDKSHKLKLSDLINESLKSKNRAEEKYTLVASQGETTTVLVTAAPIAEMDQLSERVVLVLREISREEFLQKQLYRAERFRDMDQLVGGIAHDFNNLLAGILGAAEIVKLKYSKSLTKPGSEWIDKILNQANLASAITEKLTQFTSKKGSKFTPVNLNACITDVISILEQTKAKHLSITFRSDSNSHILMGNEGLLQSVILNLLLNATHVVSSVDGCIWVELKKIRIREHDMEHWQSYSMAPGTYHSLVIEDNGPGIQTDIIDKIFDPFFTTRPQGRGSGLGLSAAFEAVRDHGGTILVENSEPQGAKFTVVLPQSKETEIGQAAHLQNASLGSLNSSTLKAGKYLIVEDDPEQLANYANFFSIMGCESKCACNGRTALEILEKEKFKFDLILADINMPEMSGTELYQHLQKVGYEGQFIAMSGYADRKKMGTLARQKNVGFLKKPFKLDDFRRLLLDRLGAGDVEGKSTPKPQSVKKQSEEMHNLH